MKIILTGVTGMVGEGVLMECLQNSHVTEILSVSRKHYDINHPKLKELIVPDFMKIEQFSQQLSGFDACFFCAGISSIGMSEKEFTQITYDTTLHFAKILLQLNPLLVFNYVSGMSTDSTGSGKIMWARIKGRTENALMNMTFRGQYNFRPGFMKPFPGQKNVKPIFKFFGLIYPRLFPGSSLTLQEVGQAMIQTSINANEKKVLEVSDIKELLK